MVGAHKELLQQLSIYGNIIQCVNSYSFFVFNFNTAFIRWRMLDEYPHEEYTEVMWVQYERIDNARQNLSHFPFALSLLPFSQTCTEEDGRYLVLRSPASDCIRARVRDAR